MSDVRLADDVPHEPVAPSEWQSLAELLGVDLERVDRMAQIAWRLYDDRQYREAAAVFRGLMHIDPENIDLYRGYSLAAAKDHDLLAATFALDQALLLLGGKEERESDRAQLLALRAAFLYRSGRRREAVESAEASLAFCPTAPWADSLRKGIQRASQSRASAARDDAADGRAHVRRQLQGRLEEVLSGQRSLASAIGYGDDELMHVFQNGAALLEAGQPVRARRIFEGLVALDADVPVFHLALAAAWGALNQPDRAGACLHAAVGAARLVEGGADLLADALVRRARHLASHGALDQALRDLDEALALPEPALGDDLRVRARSLRDGLASSAAPRGAANGAPNAAVER